MPYNPYYAYQTVKDHLYNSQNWSSTQVDVFNFMYGFNVMGFQPWKGIIDSIYDSRNGDLYRDRYNIKGGGYDPRKAPDSSIGAAVSGGLNFVSKNLDKLYRDD